MSRTSLDADLIIKEHDTIFQRQKHKLGTNGPLTPHMNNTDKMHLISLSRMRTISLFLAVYSNGPHTC